MTPEEVAAAAMYLKDTIGKEGVQELISNLSRDKGSISVLLLLQLIEKPILFANFRNLLLQQMGRFLFKTLSS